MYQCWAPGSGLCVTVVKLQTLLFSRKKSGFFNVVVSMAAGRSQFWFRCLRVWCAVLLSGAVDHGAGRIWHWKILFVLCVGVMA